MVSSGSGGPEIRAEELLEPGLFYSASVEEGFPQGCTSASSLCFYSLLLPVTVPVYVFFHLWTWMGLKLFRHN
ncbi:hypothetical protein STEG23_031257 [Scotinomys teguina]